MAEREQEKQSVSSMSVWEPFAHWAPLANWEPFREFPFFHPSSWFRPLEEAERGISVGRMLPAVDIVENDSTYTITVELPGASKNDITIEQSEDLLTIRGEKKSEREEKGERSHLIERRYGSFSRSFRLPANAARDRVNASFAEGVLTLQVPKVEEPKPKVISIKS